MAFRFSPGHCNDGGDCGCGGGCDACAACPGVNFCSSLQISWSNVDSGGGTATLANPAGTCQLASACTAGRLRIDLDLGTSPPTLRVRKYLSDGCPDGDVQYDCSGMTLTSSNCTFFQFVWSVTAANCAGLYSLGYRTFTVTF